MTNHLACYDDDPPSITTKENTCPENLDKSPSLLPEFESLESAST